MTMHIVPVERAIEQIEDGRRYKGHMEIGGSRLAYELTFGQQVREVLELEPTADADEFRRRFQLTLRRDGAEIELTKEEYALFVVLLVGFAVEFYENPQTRDANAGGLGAVIRGEGMFGIDGIKASISMTCHGSCEISAKTRLILTQPKFGCAIPSA